MCTKIDSRLSSGPFFSPAAPRDAHLVIRVLEQYTVLLCCYLNTKVSKWETFSADKPKAGSIDDSQAISKLYSLIVSGDRISSQSRVAATAPQHSWPLQPLSLAFSTLPDRRLCYQLGLHCIVALLPWNPAPSSFQTKFQSHFPSHMPKPLQVLGSTWVHLLSHLDRDAAVRAMADVCSKFFWS